MTCTLNFDAEFAQKCMAVYEFMMRGEWLILVLARWREGLQVWPQSILLNQDAVFPLMSQLHEFRMWHITCGLRKSVAEFRRHGVLPVNHRFLVTPLVRNLRLTWKFSPVENIYQWHSTVQVAILLCFLAHLLFASIHCS